MSEVVYRRCKYIIEENDRVLAFAKAMEAGDVKKAGEILKVAQKGMATEYEISCPEIDFMADLANVRPDVIGARMMGGGFGGCTINLLKRGAEDAFISELSTAYQSKFGKTLTPIPVSLEDGVRLV